MRETGATQPEKTLPTGTVTFLFSDIEGSTERWDRNRDAMQEALKRHDAVLRSIIEVHGGYVFKTIGDAFCAAFSTAPDAVKAALAAQRGLAAENWSAVGGLRVRMAIHTGDVYARDGDYFGPAVNRVARLLAIAHGGQVVVSGVATELCQGQLPAQVTLRDLGAHRLRDLAHPEQVYQLVAPELQSEFPALRSLDELPNNLPLQVTSFVGRDEQLAEIKALLGKSRLVTLLAAGGVGKTRTALQVGADLLDAYPDGVWLVELGSLSDPNLVSGAVASALGVKESAGRPLFETLTAYLRSKKALILLDNCEHVIAAAAKVADGLIHACPKVSVLSTGREGLGIAGETVLRLPSLSVPESTRDIDAAQAGRYGAIALFVDRANAVDSSFTLTDENAPHIAEICRRLDGIALAIELAAARVKVLNVVELAKRLDQRFRLLTGGSRTALPRQQTMRALIDWSYDLLTPEEQTLFRRVSVFAGGWTLEAASAVCGDETTESFEMLDRLSALVDKSLVVVDFDERSQRYRLSETTRQYAFERLTERGERPALANLHADYFYDLALRVDPTWLTTPTRAWVAIMAPEVDNFRAALGWLLEQKQNALLGMKLTGALLWYWSDYALAEGRRWVQLALDHAHDPDIPVDVLAKLWLCKAVISRGFTERSSAGEAAQRAIELYKQLDDPLGLAEAELMLASSQIFLGEPVIGRELVTKALETFRRLNQPGLVAMALRELANADDIIGESQRARHLYREALKALEEQGLEREVAVTAANLAEAEFQAGNVQAALDFNAQSLVIQRSLKHFARLTVSLHNRSAYLLSLGQLAQARDMARESLLMARDLDAKIYIGYTIQTLAAIACAKADCERAARLTGYSTARLAEFQVQREFTEQREFNEVMQTLNETFEAARLNALFDEGALWTEDKAVAEALAI